MRKIVLALALAGTFLSAPANARDGAVYAGVSGGAVFGDGFEANLDLDDDDIIDDDEIAVLDFDTQTGWELEGLAGYDFGMFRAEAEGAYKSMGVGDLTTNSFVVVNPLAPVTQTEFETDGDISVLSLMANG